MKTVGNRLTGVEARLFDRVPGFLSCSVSGLPGVSGAGVTLLIRTQAPGATEARATVLALSAQELARTDFDPFVAELAGRIERVTE